MVSLNEFCCLCFILYDGFTTALVAQTISLSPVEKVEIRENMPRICLWLSRIGSHIVVRLRNRLMNGMKKKKEYERKIASQSKCCNRRTRRQYRIYSVFYMFVTVSIILLYIFHFFFVRSLLFCSPFYFKLNFYYTVVCNRVKRA